MNLVELRTMKESEGFGWCFAPEGIIDGYECIIKDCPLPCIFEAFPKGTAVWYSICALHGWMVGLNAYYDDTTGGHTHGSELEVKA